MKKKEVVHPLLDELRDCIPMRFSYDDKNTVEAIQNLVNDWRDKFNELDEMEKKYHALQRETKESFGLLAQFAKAPNLAVSEVVQKTIDKLNDRAIKIEGLENNLAAYKSELRDVQVRLYEVMNPNAPAESATGDIRRLALEVSRYVGTLEEENDQQKKQIAKQKHQLDNITARYREENKARVALEAAYGEGPKKKPEETLQATVSAAIRDIDECWDNVGDGRGRFHYYNTTTAEAIMRIGNCVNLIAARLKM
jgi:flagellar biosynthesis chaperone FliJ